MHYKKEGKYPAAKKMFQPVQCNHCEDAPCEKNCPTGATYHAEDGTVQITVDECIGCRTCIIACPYKARQFNFRDPKDNPAYGIGKDYWGNAVGTTPFENAKASRHTLDKAEKCTLCKERRKAGEIPACAEACLVSARIFGDLDNPNSDISKEIKRTGAKQFFQEMGTKPSVYYAGKTFPDKILAGQ